MMLIPAWHIAVLAFLYAAEYYWRAWRRREQRYMYLGKAGGRTVLAAAYLCIELAHLTPPEAQILIRWSLLILLSTDLLFVIQEHIIDRRRTHEH